MNFRGTQLPSQTPVAQQLLYRVLAVGTHHKIGYQYNLKDLIQLFFALTLTGGKCAYNLVLALLKYNSSEAENNLDRFAMKQIYCPVKYVFFS